MNIVMIKNNGVFSFFKKRGGYNILEYSQAMLYIGKYTFIAVSYILYDQKNQRGGSMTPSHSLVNMLLIITYLIRFYTFSVIQAFESSIMY